MRSSVSLISHILVKFQTMIGKLAKFQVMIVLRCHDTVFKVCKLISKPVCNVLYLLVLGPYIAGSVLKEFNAILYYCLN